MSESLYFDDLNVNDAIADQTFVVEPTQMFFFSAATYNGHRIHYDRRWATEVEGHRDLVVHGPLQAALMAKTITDWIGPDGSLKRLALQYRTSAFPAEELHFNGEITEMREENGMPLVELSIREQRAADDILMPGTATVSLPRR